MGGKRCQAVTQALGRGIISGSYAPGTAVPTEAALGALFGVSRTTVREAVKHLQAKGLVSVSPRHGTHVLPTHHWNQFDAELLSWRVSVGIDTGLLDQLYEIRDCFEPRACAMAACGASTPDRRHILDCFDRLGRPDLDIEQRIAADVEFHVAIFAATGNLFFVSLGAAIRTALHLSFALSQRRQPFPRSELRLHADICSAIQSGDAALAERSMRLLLDASRRTLRMTLKTSVENA